MIERPRGRKGGRAVRVYDPASGCKVYVGTRYTLREARALEREKGAEFAKRLRPRGRPWTVAEWGQRWLERYPRPEATTRYHNALMVKYVSQRLGTVRLDHLTRVQARELALESENLAKVAAAMFKNAIYDEQIFPGPNPFEKLGLAKSKGRGGENTPILTEAELLLLAGQAVETHGAYGRHLRAMIVFQGYVGLRPGEMFGLRWEDIDFQARTVAVERQRRKDGMARPKTKEPRLVALADAAADALTGMDFTAEGWVFVTPSMTQFSASGHRYYWNDVRNDFEHQLPDGHWLPGRRDKKGKRVALAMHELRHVCASMMAENGATARVIAYQLGITEKVARETYIHTYADSARAAALAALNGPPAGVVALKRTGGA